MKPQMEMRNILLDTGEEYKVVKNLTQLCLCSSVLWKVELVSNEIACLAEEISKQNIEGEAQFFLTAYSEMQEDRNQLKKGLLSKREPKLKYLVPSQPIHTAENTKDVLE